MYSQPTLAFLRDLSAIEAAEVSEEEPIFKLAPLAEMTLVGTEPGAAHARVQTLARAPGGDWLVQVIYTNTHAYVYI